MNIYFEKNAQIRIELPETNIDFEKEFNNCLHFGFIPNEPQNKIIEHFKDGAKFGIEIIYVHEEEKLGTAGALKKAAQHITNTFITCNGDDLAGVFIDEILIPCTQNPCCKLSANTLFEIDFGHFDFFSQAEDLKNIFVS